VADRSVRIRRGAALAAAVGGAVTDAGYLRLVSEQESAIDGRIAFVAAFIAVVSALALVGVLLSDRDPGRSQLAILGSASGLIGVGFIGLWSIGSPLILCAVLALFAVGPRVVSRPLIGATIMGSIAVLAAGLVLTS
jgi:hypothetical protein